MKKLAYALIFSLFIVSNGIFTFKYECAYSDGGPDFYGFPFVQETDHTWVNSLSGEIYLAGYLSNLLIWTIIGFGLSLLLKRISWGKAKQAMNIVAMAMAGLALAFSIFTFSLIDWRYHWSHDNFKMNHYQNEIECQRTFQFLRK